MTSLLMDIQIGNVSCLAFSDYDVENNIDSDTYTIQ